MCAEKGAGAGVGVTENDRLHLKRGTFIRCSWFSAFQPRLHLHALLRFLSVFVVHVCFSRCCIKRRRGLQGAHSRPGCAGSPGSSSRLTAPLQPEYLRLVLQPGGQACGADTSKAWHYIALPALGVFPPQLPHNWLLKWIHVHLLHRYVTWPLSAAVISN